MRRFLLDTNAVGALAARRNPITERVRAARQKGSRIGTCEPVVAELYFGVELSATRDTNSMRLRHILSGIRSWPFDRLAAEG